MDWEAYFVRGLEFLFLGIGTWFDIKDRELPLPFLTLFGVVGIACNVLWKYQSPESVVMGSILGGTFLLVGWISNEKIGYGDGIGLVVLGIFEGFREMIPVLGGAFLFSGIYGLWKLVGLKSSVSDTMPFFPCLLLAFVGVKLL